MGKKKDTKVMDELLAAAAEMEWGNYIDFSKFVDLDSILADEMLERMATGIVDAALLSGHRPILGSQKILISDNPWYKNSKTVAAKLRAAMSATPMQFIAFCGFMLHKATEQKNAAETRERRTRERLERVEMLAENATSLRRLRTSLQALDEIDD